MRVGNRNVFSLSHTHTHTSSLLQLTVSLLIPGAFQAVYNTAQPDVEQPYLSVQVVDFLFKGTGAGSSAPVCSHRPRHEVHSHDEAQRQHCAFGVALELLQDVKAGQGEERDTSEPEEASKDGVEQVKETSQEH